MVVIESQTLPEEWHCYRNGEIHWNKWLLPPGRDPGCELRQEIFLPKDALNILMAQVPSILIKYNPKVYTWSGSYKVEEVHQNTPSSQGFAGLSRTIFIWGSPLYLHLLHYKFIEETSYDMVWKSGLKRIFVSFDNGVSLTKELFMTSYVSDGQWGQGFLGPGGCKCNPVTELLSTSLHWM